MSILQKTLLSSYVIYNYLLFLLSNFFILLYCISHSTTSSLDQRVYQSSTLKIIYSKIMFLRESANTCFCISTRVPFYSINKTVGLPNDHWLSITVYSSLYDCVLCVGDQRYCNSDYDISSRKHLQCPQRYQWNNGLLIADNFTQTEYYRAPFQSSYTFLTMISAFAATQINFQDQDYYIYLSIEHTASDKSNQRHILFF